MRALLVCAEGLGGEAEMKLVDYKRAEGGADEAGGKLGGTKEVSTDDKDVKAAAQEVVKQLSAQSNSLEKMELAEVPPLLPRAPFPPSPALHAVHAHGGDGGAW